MVKFRFRRDMESFVALPQGTPASRRCAVLAAVPDDEVAVSELLRALFVRVVVVDKNVARRSWHDVRDSTRCNNIGFTLRARHAVPRWLNSSRASRRFPRYGASGVVACAGRDDIVYAAYPPFKIPQCLHAATMHLSKLSPKSGYCFSWRHSNGCIRIHRNVRSMISLLSC